MDAENFWVCNKKDDAIAFSKDSIAKVTALEQALSAPAPDQQAALAALKAAGGTCGACHKTYRSRTRTCSTSSRLARFRRAGCSIKQPARQFTSHKSQVTKRGRACGPSSFLRHSQ